MNRILKNIVYHAPWLFSDKRFLELSFELHMGRKLNLKDPKSLNEKIQWLKLYDRKDSYVQMADKAQAKQWAAGIIGNEHIIPTLAVWADAEQIEWDKLPSEFVLKCTHDSGGMVLCSDKSKLDTAQAKAMLKRALRSNFWFSQREWVYKDIPHRIIAEPLMRDSKQTDSLIDYKFFCFDGKPEFMYISEGLQDHSTAKITFTNLQGIPMEFQRADYASHEPQDIPLPENLQRMEQMAGQLAKASGAPFVRVDLYEIASQIYFSEMTFYPNSGFIPFRPAQWDDKLGELLEIQVAQ